MEARISFNCAAASGVSLSGDSAMMTRDNRIAGIIQVRSLTSPPALAAIVSRGGARQNRRRGVRSAGGGGVLGAGEGGEGQRAKGKGKREKVDPFSRGGGFQNSDS